MLIICSPAGEAGLAAGMLSLHQSGCRSAVGWEPQEMSCALLLPENNLSVGTRLGQSGPLPQTGARALIFRSTYVGEEYKSR